MSQTSNFTLENYSYSPEPFNAQFSEYWTFNPSATTRQHAIGQRYEKIGRMNLSRIKNAQGGRNIGIHDLQRAVFNRRPPPSLRDTARHRSSGRCKRSIGARWRYRHDIRYQLQKIMFRLPDISAAVTMARRVASFPKLRFWHATSNVSSKGILAIANWTVLCDQKLADLFDLRVDAGKMIFSRLLVECFVSFRFVSLRM